MPPPLRIAIIAAMQEELRVLQADLQTEQVEHVAAREFHAGTLHGADVILVRSHIGKVAVATTAALLIERYSVSFIVFTGVAGGLRDEVQVGDVVIADELLQHDMDASPIFPRYEIPLTGRSRFGTDGDISASLAEAATQVVMSPDSSFVAGARALGVRRPSLHRGLIVSGDRFVSTAAESALLRDALPDALAVEMEGAALAQVCHDFRVPFAVMRTISDRADDSAHVDFDRFIQDVAARATHDIVRAWLIRQAAMSRCFRGT